MKKSIVLEGYRSFSYKRLPMGILPKKWVTLRVIAVGICGTDVSKILSNNLPSNHTKVLGHEFIGEIIRINGYSNDFCVGNRVVVMPIMPCHKCEMCIRGMENLCKKAEAIGRTIDGAFSNYVNVPIENLVKIQKDLLINSYVLSDSIAVCLHAINLAKNYSQKRAKALVIGDGSIGCLISWLLKKQGIDVYIKGIHSANCNFIEKFGINSIKNLNQDDSYDEIYETVGRKQDDTLNECLKLIKPGGNVIVLGVYDVNYIYPLVARSLFIKESRLVGANAYNKNEFLDAVNIIERNIQELSTFLTHVYSLENFSEALNKVINKDELTLKVIIQPKIC